MLLQKHLPARKDVPGVQKMTSIFSNGETIAPKSSTFFDKIWRNFELFFELEIVKFWVEKSDFFCLPARSVRARYRRFEPGTVGSEKAPKRSFRESGKRSAGELPWEMTLFWVISHYREVQPVRIFLAWFGVGNGPKRRYIERFLAISAQIMHTPTFFPEVQPVRIFLRKNRKKSLFLTFFGFGGLFRPPNPVLSGPSPVPSVRARYRRFEPGTVGSSPVPKIVLICWLFCQ